MNEPIRRPTEQELWEILLANSDQWGAEATNFPTRAKYDAYWQVREAFDEYIRYQNDLNLRWAESVWRGEEPQTPLRQVTLEGINWEDEIRTRTRDRKEMLENPPKGSRQRDDQRGGPAEGQSKEEYAQQQEAKQREAEKRRLEEEVERQREQNNKDEEQRREDERRRKKEEQQRRQDKDGKGGVPLPDDWYAAAPPGSPYGPRDLEPGTDPWAIERRDRSDGRRGNPPPDLGYLPWAIPIEGSEHRGSERVEVPSIGLDPWVLTDSEWDDSEEPDDIPEDLVGGPPR